MPRRGTRTLVTVADTLAAGAALAFAGWALLDRLLGDRRGVRSARVRLSSEELAMPVDQRTPDAPVRSSHRKTPAERAEESWLTWRVHSALELLPERERVVIELAYWSGLSQTEIASYLDVPLGTVKTRTRTGLARLAGLLDEVRA